MAEPCVAIAPEVMAACRARFERRGRGGQAEAGPCGRRSSPQPTGQAVWSHASLRAARGASGLPNRETQLRIAKGIRSKRMPMRLLEARGPFARAPCRGGCGRAPYAGTMVSLVCHSCKRRMRKARLALPAPGTEASPLLRGDPDELERMVGGMWADKENLDPAFNAALMERRLRTAARVGLAGTLALARERGVDVRVECTACSQPRFVYEFGTSGMRRSGFMAHCMACRLERVDMVRARVAAAVYRMKAQDCFPPVQLRRDPMLAGPKQLLEGVVRDLLAAQRGRCYYTGIELDLDSRDNPFCLSLERLDRAKMYLDSGNVVATVAIVNIGGALNWTRRLSLQILHAGLVTLGLHAGGRAALQPSELSFLRERLRTCRLSSRRRTARAARYKEAASHARLGITIDSLLGLLERQGFRCALSGLPLALAPAHPFSLSIDRIDNAVGYERRNVRLVIARLNVGSKWVWTDDLFAAFRRRIAEARDGLLAAEGLDACLRGRRSAAPPAQLLRYLNAPPEGAQDIQRRSDQLPGHPRPHPRPQRPPAPAEAAAPAPRGTPAAPTRRGQLARPRRGQLTRQPDPFAAAARRLRPVR